MGRQCTFPFSNLTILPNGSVVPCCKYNIKAGVPNISDLTLYDNNIHELFFQPAMEEIRNSFRKGEEPEECKLCWEEEDSGITSMREHRNIMESKLKTNFDKPAIASMDFKFSSLCNLKCRICGPYCSSTWLKEAQDTGMFHEHTIKIFSKYAERKFINNEINFQIFKESIPNLKRLEFHGGEPLMQPEHSKIMEILNQYDGKLDIDVCYNTNGTIYDALAVETWKKMAFVELNISIDDIESRFEYQRYPAKWSEVFSNIQQYQKNCSRNVRVNMYTSVSLYNIFYIDELIKFNAEHFKLNLRLNLVHWPISMAIKNLPLELKNMIKFKIASLDSESKKYIDKDYSLEGIISFMMDTDQDATEFDDFLKTTNTHDEYRKQSFKDTFEEYYNLLLPDSSL